MEKSGKITKLNFKGFKFPVIDKFEKRNQNIPVINVYANEGKVIVPLRSTKKIKKNKKIHYSLINNFHRLVGVQASNNTAKNIFVKVVLIIFVLKYYRQT